MDEFVETSLKVYEFASTTADKKDFKVKNVLCETQPIPHKKNQSTQTAEMCNACSQTEDTCSDPKTSSFQVKELALWLKHIYPVISAELLDGTTPIHGEAEDSVAEFSMIPYQRIPSDGKQKEKHSNGEATWLSTRLDNIPCLILSSSPPHKGWCEHVEQTLSLYVPKRIPHGHYIVFTEVQTIPVKACIQFLSKNPWKKDFFVGITVACDLYLWEHTFSSDIDEIKELAYTSISYSSIVGIDWLCADDFLVAHSDGTICLWKISQKLVLEKRFVITPRKAITKILALSQSNFVVGTEEGHLLYCSTLQSSTEWRHSGAIEINFTDLEKHAFTIVHLSRGMFNGTDVLISYDISGEFFIHDVRNAEDGPLLLIKMPLPFKNSIACSKNVEYVISQTKDGSFELFGIKNGKTSYANGCFTEKGSLLKLSDNGAWLITGVQNGTFQILSIKKT